MIRSVRTLTEPAYEPVTLEEARIWCRVDSDDTTQDAMLLILITAARERAEDLTGVAFAERTMELRLDEFPDSDNVIEVPHPPLKSVDYVTYATDDGDLSLDVGSPSDLLVDTGSFPGRIAPAYGEGWPTARNHIGSVRIGFTGGYDNGNAIPKRLRLWLQQRVSTWFDNREHLLVGSVKDAPRDFVDGLLDNLRIGTWFV